MKALTLHQPWALAIALGWKRFETRAWETAYRGRLAIHAGKARTKEGREVFARLRRQFVRTGYSNFEELPFGCVLGTARLRRIYTTEFLTGQPVGRAILDRFVHPSLEVKLGDFGPDRFAWLLDDFVPLVQPVEARGYQKLWNWREAA